MVTPMKNEVAISERNNFVPLPSQHELEVLNVIAQQAVSSKMYRNVGDLPGLLMVMLAARELNISPVMAINGGLSIIQGKVEISARLMNALIRKAGHSIKKIKESNDICVLVGKRNDNQDLIETSYSIEEAKAAGLVRPGSNWIKYPKDMLFARALSRLARQLFSDVIGIGYVEGEISGAIYSENSSSYRENDFKDGIDICEDKPILLPSEIKENQKEKSMGSNGTGCQTSQTEQTVRKNEETGTEREKILIDKLLKEFEKTDHENLIVYIDEIMKHFDWTLEKTLEELTKDTVNSKQKFAKWKMLKEKKK